MLSTLEVDQIKISNITIEQYKYYTTVCITLLATSTSTKYSI